MIFEVTKMGIMGLVVSAAGALLPKVSFAAEESFVTYEELVHSRTEVLEVELNENTVLCSVSGYSMPMLKVLVPGLEKITLLDHQNRGAGAPCVTTGEVCHFDNEGGARPEDILMGRIGKEKIAINVSVTRIEQIDREQETCDVYMRERVETNIRGKVLTHVVSTKLGKRSFTDCGNGAPVR